MNYRFRSFAAMAAISLASLASTPALPAKTDLDNVCVSVGRLLEEGHKAGIIPSPVDVEFVE